jgi:hypothetical protein
MLHVAGATKCSSTCNLTLPTWNRALSGFRFQVTCYRWMLLTCSSACNLTLATWNGALSCCRLHVTCCRWMLLTCSSTCNLLLATWNGTLSSYSYLFSLHSSPSQHPRSTYHLPSHPLTQHVHRAIEQAHTYCLSWWSRSS